MRCGETSYRYVTLPFPQYYEMSYGLNVEMHKQVGGGTTELRNFQTRFPAFYSKAPTGNKHGPDLSNL